MMKKLLAVFLLLAVSLASGLPALAATSQSGNVTGVWGGITPPDGDTPVYSVQVEFDSMEFTYTHDRSTAESAWSSDKNTVSVANYSNADLAVSITYVAKEGFTDISGSFGEHADFTLESAANKTMATAANKTASLSLRGTLPRDVATLATIGSVTVAISVVQ